MTSLCDYAHPERYDTTVLERQGVGKMFPYHLDMYKEASDLYGPGSLLAWYLLISSFTLTCAFWPITTINSAGNEQRRLRRPRITADLLAIVLYAVFAATDVLIQAVALLGLENRVGVITCLRFPHLDHRSEYLDDGDVDPSTLPPLPAELPPELLEYGQKIISITGPLPICYIALVVTTAWFFTWRAFRPGATLNRTYRAREEVTWNPSPGVVRLVLAMAAYVALCLVAYHLMLGNTYASGLLGFLELCWPCWVAATCGAIIGIVILVTVAIWLVGSNMMWYIGNMLDESSAARGGEPPLDTNSIFGFLFAAFGGLSVFSCLLFLAFTMTDVSLLTDLGKPLTERGQLASLLVGVATTSYSSYDVFRVEGRRWWRNRATANAAVELTDLLAEEGRNR